MVEQQQHPCPTTPFPGRLLVVGLEGRGCCILGVFFAVHTCTCMDHVLMHGPCASVEPRVDARPSAVISPPFSPISPSAFLITPPQGTLEARDASIDPAPSPPGCPEPAPHRVVALRCASADAYRVQPLRRPPSHQDFKLFVVQLSGGPFAAMCRNHALQRKARENPEEGPFCGNIYVPSHATQKKPFV